VDGTPFGRYRLIELLGRGGMGEVWRACDTETNNRTVAIKLLPPHLAQDHTFVQRFRREADAAAQLNNPHVVPIHNYGEIDGRLYVDMRLIEGRDLQAVLAAGPLKPAQAVRIVEQVAKALHAAHKVGLVHRDVKPSNILVDEDDFAYLIDFGIARGADQTRMTGTSGVIGSWPYLAPERLRAGQVDGRADVYALACVLYECLTGATPFPGGDTEQQIAAHFMEPPPRPSITDPNVPASLDAVIATGMAKDPDQRYATTVELSIAARDAITTPLALSNEPIPLDQTRPASTAAGRQESAEPAQAATQQAVPADGADRPHRLLETQPAGETVEATPKQWWSWQRRQVKVAVIAATVVVLAVSASITDYLLREPSTTSQPAAVSQPTTTQTPTTIPLAPPVTEAALEGLLLSSDQINTAMGTSGMTTGRLPQGPTVMDDDSDKVADKACRPLDGNLIAPVYAGSGWTASREQLLQNFHWHPGDLWTEVDQGVVLFPTAHDAEAFFTASTQQWPACANRQFTLSRPGSPDEVFAVGPVSNTDGILRATKTRPTATKGSPLACPHQRALTVANNVVIDVSACSYTEADPAVNLAHQIATKVPA
jgi:hypothetical protein